MKALSVLLLFVALQSPTPSKGKTGQPKQQEAAANKEKPQNDKCGTEDSPLVVKVLPTVGTDDQTQKSAEKSGEKSATDRRLAFFTGVLAIVAALQLATLIWQILTTRSTMQKQLRAYVLVSRASRRKENNIADTTLTVALFNSGQTPALNCRTETFRGIGPMVRPLPPIPDIDKTKALQSISFIGAGNDTWAMAETDTLTAEEERDINQGVRGIYVIGTVHYEDVFGKSHTTRYRLVCTGEENLSAGKFVFCDEGNSAD